MICYHANYQLKRHHTFGTPCLVNHYLEFNTIEELQDYFANNKKWRDYPILIMGNGSNLLFVNDFAGLIIKPETRGMQVIEEDETHVWIEVGAGEIWDDFVSFAASKAWGGIENLSAIPGKVGAAAAQNIGAYGVEVEKHIELVNGLNISKQELQSIGVGDCHYGYRDSIFKNELKNRFIITSVVFRLDKTPEYNLTNNELREKINPIAPITVNKIRETIIDIRNSKLPDTSAIGNAGSFFMNPIVESKQAENLLHDFPNMPHYPALEGKIKLAAGWLIEQCGWKGFRSGDAGVHDKQALVLVNYGNANGSEVYELSEKIRRSVIEKFGVDLEREVEVIGLNTDKYKAR